MNIDWQAFTPLSALAGGALIGLAAGLLILLSGRIAGISGILGGLLSPRTGDIGWRLAFVAGILATPLLAAPFIELRAPTIEASHAVLVGAGLLVGFGTRLGAGCTSGHGVCGLARLSPRSVAATVCFMFAGVATVYVVRHLLGGGGGL
jgi:uncharacterized membrane protein YedE/YeeE